MSRWLMRAYPGKESVRIYDYADVRVPVLRGMLAKRQKTYESLGFSETRHGQPTLLDGLDE